MLISCNKLKTHIKDADSIDWKHLWENFTIRTAEVENVYEVGHQFDGVVVAEIKECIDHPDSDHMHVLQLDCGEKDLVQVVCGAPNVRVGLKTAMIKVGGRIEDISITARPLRGIISNGMCCSGKELGISDNHDGIIELPSDAPVGMDIKKYLPILDTIVEIDNKSLTNRPDLWGHFGIAREVCAITNHELLPLDIEEVKNTKEDLDIVIKSPLCLRYSGLKIENVLNNKTPLDMQIFLYYVGMRSISLLVDLTNYLMLELGQPMHAFDARVVKNIEVDCAKDGDTYVTLDGVARKLTNDTLMIKNENQYFGIAGIMGGLDSEILSDTTSLFLESANFQAGSIRKSAVHLGLRTESSARYEKSLDPNMTDLAIKRFLYLLRKENKDLVVASNLTDIYPNPLESGHIVLNKSLLNTYMGKVLRDEEVVSILERLGFKVEVMNDSYHVEVPTYRHTKDIFIAEDLIEEIARIYGLEKIEVTPLKLDLIASELDTVFNQEYEVKKVLATRYNMHEVHSYMWYDSNTMRELGIEKDGVKLLGKSDNLVLRDDLSFSLMNIVKRNFKNYTSFKIFEIGTIIKDNQNKRVLSVVLASDEKSLENIYMEAKSIVKYLFKVFKNKDIEIKENVNELPYYDASLGKVVIVDNERIGEINVLNKSISNKLSKKKAVVLIDIDMDKFVLLDSVAIMAKEVSKYPMVELDYTIILENKKYQDLKNVLNAFKSNLINKWSLVCIYENKYTIRYVLGSNTKTLEQAELLKFKERFIEHIKTNGLSIVE